MVTSSPATVVCASFSLSLSFSVVCTFFPQAIQRFFNDEWFNSKEQFRLPCYKCHSSAGYGGAEFTRDCYPGLYYIPQLDPQDPTWDLGGLFVCGGQCMDWLVPEAKKLGWSTKATYYTTTKMAGRRGGRPCSRPITSWNALTAKSGSVINKRHKRVKIHFNKSVHVYGITNVA